MVPIKLTLNPAYKILIFVYLIGLTGFIKGTQLHNPEPISHNRLIVAPVFQNA